MYKTLSEFITENTKPFIKVKLHDNGTTYHVIKSTHSGFKAGEKLSDADVDELTAAHDAGDIHFENASVKGSGPGKA